MLLLPTLFFSIKDYKHGPVALPFAEYIFSGRVL